MFSRDGGGGGGGGGDHGCTAGYFWKSRGALPVAALVRTKQINRLGLRLPGKWKRLLGILGAKWSPD